MVRTLNKNGLGHKIARLVAAATFLSTFCVALLLTTYQIERNLEARKESLEATAFALASAAADATRAADRQAAQFAMTAVARIPRINTAAITLANGTSLATMGQTVFLESDLIGADSSNMALLLRGTLPVSVDIIKAGERLGRLTIVSDISDLRYQVAIIALIAVATAFLTAAVGVLAARPLQKRILTPLSTVTKAMQDIRNTRDYSTSLPERTEEDEPAMLIHSFNGMMADIRFRDQALQRLAYHDPLTGLPNRVSFLRSLDHYVSRKGEVLRGAVALMNIHSFRSLNDAFGHTTGDGILMTVAAHISTALPEGTLVARTSGDEFALLLVDTVTESDVQMSLARVQAAFFKPVSINNLELHLSLNIGAVLLQDRTANAGHPDIILRDADLALSHARKQLAGSIQFFQPDHAAEIEEETNLGQALRQAISSRAFNLHYQPQFSFEEQRITGFEALARWTHDVRGPISPGVFVPLAEKLGLVAMIGDWVLLAGCQQAAIWQKQNGKARVMSINVSPAQILAAGFVEKVRAALRKSGLPPRLLCLEMTESIFVDAGLADVIVVLETLAKDGVLLALDDFGTGYSSLGYLTRLPFHIIKLDRSLVSAADKDSRKAAVLRSSVEMVHALGMKVVAEGAETSGEIALLQSLGVEKVQGFAIARPEPAEAAHARANALDQRYARQTA